MFLNWDPLPWALRGRQIELLFSGYRRRNGRTQGARFGYYLRPGHSENGEDLPPLMLVHGLAIFPEWWRPLLKKLPRSYPVCVPELLGFGRSPGRELPPEAFNLTLFREQIEQLRRVLNRPRMVLGGVSLGGWACLDYALAHPDETAGLILMAPAGATPGVTASDLRHLNTLFDYHSPEEFIRLVNGYVLRRPRPIPQWLGELAVRRSSKNGHKHLLRNLRFEDWIDRKVSKIQAPTALIWGKEDKVFPFEVGEELERCMPHARLFPVENTGHSYLFENPESTSEAFLKALRFVSGKKEDR